ncbi:MAG: diaminopimelate epimerase [Deltaproteobacteria bacterium]|nr:diaminopimelate epimerase [Deltaproteobacteria bacterium]
MRFVKYQGLGNDFILIADILADDSPPYRQRLARQLCDRHFGIGADGLLFVDPARSTAAVATMHVVNADGSEPEMCGNGLRCVALHLAERPEHLAASRLLIDTPAGPRECLVDRLGDGLARVTVDMGVATLTGEHLPSTTTPWLEQPVADGSLSGSAVNVGNPHLVIFSETEPQQLLAAHGATLELHPRFRQRTNVEFVRQSGPSQFEVAVWERGCGPTLACGSGACAVAYAAVRLGRLAADTPATVQLPGGALAITVDGKSDRVLMEGPAERVFSGSVEI